MSTGESSHSHSTNDRSKVNANTRVYEFLSALSKKKAVLAPLGVVMSEALGIKESDQNNAAMKAATVLFTMMELADREVQYYLPNEVDFYTKESAEVREALSIMVWAHPWQNVAGRLTAAHLMHFKHAGQRFKQLSPECEIRVDELDAILASIGELRKAIEDLRCPAAAKYKLRERCMDLTRSVESYRFWGVQGIEVAFEATVGAMLPLPDKDESGKPTKPWLRVAQIISTISNLVGTANTACKNAHDAFLALESVTKSVAEHGHTVIETIERSF